MDLPGPLRHPGPMTGRHRFGRRAEDLVAAHLRTRGWRVLDRNWRFHHKELDVVAERDGMVAFVEVKGRSLGALGHPLESITAAKRRDLITAARAWIASRGRAAFRYRFDAAVVVRDGSRLTLEYFEDAWRV
jgi:putative endonuclease